MTDIAERVIDKADPESCGCPEHRPGLSPLALILHEQGIGCNWDDRAPYRNRSHYESPYPDDPVLAGLVQEVIDAGPFPHDGAFHWGDHQRVADALSAVGTAVEPTPEASK